MGSRFAATAAVTAALALATPARADDVTAVEHAKRAQVAYALQDWKTAEAEYQAAYRLEQKPEYLWALGQTQRLSGDCAAAIKSYKAFARSALNANQVTTASLHINKCEAEMARQELEKKEPTPAPTTAPAPAPTATATATPAPAPTPAEPPPPPKHWYGDALGHALVIGGVAATATGVVFLVKDAPPDSYDATASRAVGVGGLVVGGTLLVNGILRYVLVDGSVPKDSRPHVSAVVAPGTAGVGLSGQF